MAHKYKVIISDLHMGSGHADHALNPLESFDHDEKLVELIRYYSTDYFDDEEVELIINGDFYDFLQTDSSEGFTDQVHEALAVEKLHLCIEGHPEIHDALAAFIRAPHKTITVLPGNHDYEFVFPRVQEAFCQRVTGHEHDERMQFICDSEYYEFDGVQVHHGQQFELMHASNFEAKFLARKNAPPILNYPWGSRFILQVIVRLKRDRPYIDKIRPFRAYMIRAFVLDFWFFWKIMFLAIRHFLVTRLGKLRYRENLKSRLIQSWRLLSEIQIYPDLAHKVERLFTKRPDLHTIVIGHTHVAQVRQFGKGRRYINTGCWTDTVSLDFATFGRRNVPTYAFITYEEGEPTAKLLEWHGFHDLYRELRVL